MIRALVVAIAALLATAVTASAQDCTALGKPSFTAQRTLKDGNRVVGRGVVYASPSAERQENMLGANKEITILNDKGRYVWIDGLAEGFFWPTPRFPRIDRPQIQTERVGANTRFSEIVPTDSGGLGVGNSVLCSPQGVPLRQELVITDPQGRTKRLVIEHSGVRLQRLPRNLFSVPRNVRFQTMRGR